ncbi:MAG: DUF302 domain-containing protein [Proteobacteria bacterium]|nr:DUF302 domain-containing protein [Pseudomonadota bacterium]
MLAAIARTCATLALVSFLAAVPATLAGADAQDGVVRVKSAYAMQDTIARIKKDIAAKGIMFFTEVDQSALARKAGVTLNPSTLLVFGNPPLGTLFLTANPDSGLDWPVRLLVRQDDKGDVWAIYTDFGWIARRHTIKNRDAQVKMASMVIESITSSIQK